MAIIKSPAHFLPSTQKAKEIIFLKWKFPGVLEKVNAAQQHLKAEVTIITPYRFPKLMYGAALSTSNGTSDQKASDQLEDAQTVVADPKTLLQVWG